MLDIIYCDISQDESLDFSEMLAPADGFMENTQHIYW